MLKSFRWATQYRSIRFVVLYPGSAYARLCATVKHCTIKFTLLLTDKWFKFLHRTLDMTMKHCTNINKRQPAAQFKGSKTFTIKKGDLQYWSNTHKCQFYESSGWNCKQTSPFYPGDVNRSQSNSIFNRNDLTPSKPIEVQLKSIEDQSKWSIEPIKVNQSPIKM